MPKPRLSQDAEERINAEVDAADGKLFYEVRAALEKLSDGTLTLAEFRDICDACAEESAIPIFFATLREWAKKGIPRPLFDAIANEQVEIVAKRLEFQFTIFGPGYLPGKVLDVVRKALPGQIQQFRVENDFHRLTVTPLAVGSAESERAIATKGRVGSLQKRAAWLRDRLRERSWNKHEVQRQSGPNYKTVQKILDGFPVQDAVLEKLVVALNRKKKGSLDVVDIPTD